MKWLLFGEQMPKDGTWIFIRDPEAQDSISIGYCVDDLIYLVGVTDYDQVLEDPEDSEWAPMPKDLIKNLELRKLTKG